MTASATPENYTTLTDVTVGGTSFLLIWQASYPKLPSVQYGLASSQNLSCGNS